MAAKGWWVRGLYVYQRLSMKTTCKKMGVPRSTTDLWTQGQPDKGDDRDTVRAAVPLDDDNFSTISKKLTEDGGTAVVSKAQPHFPFAAKSCVRSSSWPKR